MSPAAGLIRGKDNDLLDIPVHIATDILVDSPDSFQNDVTKRIVLTVCGIADQTGINITVL